MKMQRPAISDERNGCHNDRNGGATETSFLNRKCEKVITADFINRVIVGFGCDVVITVKNPTYGASLDACTIRTRAKCT